MRASPPPRRPPDSEVAGQLRTAADGKPGGSWATPAAAGPVDATVRVPGSKSVTNRGLVLAALAAGPSRIVHPLRSRDTELMAAALRSLGATVEAAGAGPDDAWRVSPLDRAASHRNGSGRIRVDVGNAGTVLRFTPPLAALTHRSVSFDGDDAVRRRPVDRLLAALRDLGANVDGTTAPFTVTGAGRLRGGSVDINASASSQLVSALLLAAPAFEQGVRVRHVGGRQVPNAPHLAMTVAMLRERGVTVDDATPAQWAVQPGEVQPSDVVVEPDLSSAAPFLAAALVTGGRVRLTGWPPVTTQPGRLLPDLLAAFGATVDRDAGSLVVQGGGSLVGADVDLRDCGELTPVVAALAAVASTPSRLSGIDYLRGHETDRLAALALELTKLGAAVTEWDDGLHIVPKPLRGNVFSSYGDHRMVMAAAVIGLVVPGIVVEDAATVSKTYPGFIEDWATMVESGCMRG